MIKKYPLTSLIDIKPYLISKTNPAKSLCVDLSISVLIDMGSFVKVEIGKNVYNIDKTKAKHLAFRGLVKF